MSDNVKYQIGDEVKFKGYPYDASETIYEGKIVHISTETDKNGNPYVYYVILGVDGKEYGRGDEEIIGGIDGKNK